MMDLDKLTTTVVADGYNPTEFVEPRCGRSEKLGKVWITPTTKAILAAMVEGCGIGGPSHAAAMILEELRKEGQLSQVWKAHKNRMRRENYKLTNQTEKST